MANSKGAANSARQMNSELTRNATLDALYQLLLEKPWKDISMTALAHKAGVSRQTIYNEFGSRINVAEAYVIRLSSGFAIAVQMGFASHEGDAVEGFKQAFDVFFQLRDQDPLLSLVQKGDPPADLLYLLSAYAHNIDRVSGQALADIFQSSWLNMDAASAESASRLLIRLCLSNILREPDDIAQTTLDSSAVFGSFLKSKARPR